jgi:hypothetical protein
MIDLGKSYCNLINAGNNMKKINIPTKLRGAVKSILKYRHARQYHQKHARETDLILKSIENHTGRKLDKNCKKLCDDYAVEILGHKHFAPWLYVYSRISGEFKEGWIPDNYYGSVVVPKLQGKYGRVSFLKPLNGLFFQRDVFPDLLSYVNGVFFDSCYKVVPAESVKKILFRDQDRVVFKLDNSRKGLGIYVFSRESFSLEKIKQLGNGLFQRFIKQHDLFTKFTQSSVATLRLTTICENDGAVSVRAGYLKMARQNETHVKAKNSVLVPVNPEDGVFNDFGYKPGWIETEVHPDTNIAFSGQVIPHFEECVETVTELHKKVPFARNIGWDLTVDNADNVQIMEWNGWHNGVKFAEATQGPCFADLGWEKLGMIGD